jgi:hypothetical protein
VAALQSVAEELAGTGVVVEAERAWPHLLRKP